MFGVYELEILFWVIKHADLVLYKKSDGSSIVTGRFSSEGTTLEEKKLVLLTYPREPLCRVASLCVSRGDLSRGPFLLLSSPDSWTVYGL